MGSCPMGTGIGMKVQVLRIHSQGGFQRNGREREREGCGVRSGQAEAWSSVQSTVPIPSSFMMRGGEVRKKVGAGADADAAGALRSPCNLHQEDLSELGCMQRACMYSTYIQGKQGGKKRRSNWRGLLVRRDVAVTDLDGGGQCADRCEVNRPTANVEGPELHQHTAVRGFPGKLFAGMPEKLAEWLLDEGTHHFRITFGLQDIGRFHPLAVFPRPPFPRSYGPPEVY
ncbi:hypothetical protein BO70DRAFT_85099 [Aspergillus heteromorphus CBS 117.55]|uniref:Uncharacterized protein n=1 Tax=Aspergillus heteromorphus CBS 117.55 TaxID=1448321 RepID=A0A317X0K6_9EURO|nr:uncharacterized protein BO70DRAFT_85099 [Aspergillus heteromorphus CBS 117.55]PWY91102.1 hypothetical protein BO70DRAFT_85099 [Aspergillus heteromorphus CBS 117.55]